MKTNTKDINDEESQLNTNNQSSKNSSIDQMLDSLESVSSSGGLE